MRVLVAPDKFKGSLTALEVATAIGEGLEAAGVASRLLPLADGGDGSVAAALHAGSSARPVAACNVPRFVQVIARSSQKSKRSGRSTTSLSYWALAWT